MNNKLNMSNFIDLEPVRISRKHHKKKSIVEPIIEIIIKSKPLYDLEPIINDIECRSNHRVEVSIYEGMLHRCYDPKSSSYKYYGGKGITVSSNWRRSFYNFYRDMGDRPKGLTIDRINNKKGYSKDNCRWATII